LGKNYPLAVGLWGDTQSGLAELAERLAQTMTAEQKEAAVERTAKLTAAHAAAREKLRVSIAEQRPARPMTSNVFMHALSEVLPPDVAVVEEAVTTTNTMFERLGALQNTTGYFGHRGWALGWGLGVSLGVQLAWPRRPVLAILGEGASMYGIQGLWTAARYALPVTFVIANNAQYRILKICAGQLDLPTAARGEYLGMDLNQPEIDFVALSQSLGVEGCRIAEPEELAERVAANFKDRRPLLIDVPIQRESGGKLNYG